MSTSLLLRLPPSSVSGIAETLAWLTDLLTSYDGHEQRSQLRGVPVVGLALQFAAMSAADSQLIESLLLAGSTEVWRMPLWPHRRRLTASAAPGATSLSADLTWVPRLPQGGSHGYCLWSNTGTYELLAASAVADGAITLSAPLVGTWPAGSLLMPTLLGRLDGPPSVSRLTRAEHLGQLAFTSDPVDADGYLLPEPTSGVYDAEAHYGYDVLTGLWGSYQPWDGEGFVRQATLLGAEPGKRSWDAQEPMGATTRTLHAFCSGAEEVAALRAFLDARQGRTVPFWLPSWNADLTILAAESLTLDVYDPVDEGYLDRLFPLGPQRRHLQLWRRGDAPSYHLVTGGERQSATVITLELDTALPSGVDSGWLASFLRFSRLDTDAPRLDWQGDGVQCDLAVREIPSECPAEIPS